MRKSCIISLFLIAITWLCHAQQTSSSAGSFSGSLESNSIYYLNDGDVKRPKDIIGSNNYAKLSFSRGNMSAGLQWEAYLPVLQGYPSGYDKARLTAKYVNYHNEGFNVRVGDFYEQFGSGLLFRSWEDRDLGINTSLEGINVSYSYNDIVSARLINGRPRIFMGYAQSMFRGVDTRLSLASLFGLSNMEMAVEWSYIDRYQEVDGSIYGNSSVVAANVGGYSARANVNVGGFSLKGEYVNRSADPMILNSMSEDKGMAVLIEAGYSGGNTGITASFRELYNMAHQNVKESADGIYGMMNYVPALTQQYTYTLACLNPYSTHTDHEIGAQTDLFHNFRRNSKLGGKRGMKAHLNASAWFGPEFYTEGNRVLYYRDISFDIDKSISKNLKVKGLYSFQTYNPVLRGIYGQKLWKSHIAVLDILCKLNGNRSLRMEMQHLLSDADNSKSIGTDNIKYCSNWASSVVEFNVAPKWSFYAQDSWNYSGTGKHYFNGGASYSYSGIRIDCTFGRYMQGYLCSGGVCRMVPAYSGGNLKLAVLF